jgi:hypothetical protein
MAMLLQQLVDLMMGFRPFVCAVYSQATLLACDELFYRSQFPAAGRPLICVNNGGGLRLSSAAI